MWRRARPSAWDTHDSRARAGSGQASWGELAKKQCLAPRDYDPVANQSRRVCRFGSRGGAEACGPERVDSNAEHDRCLKIILIAMFLEFRCCFAVCVLLGDGRRGVCCGRGTDTPCRPAGVFGPRDVAALLAGRFAQPLRTAPAWQRERAAAAGWRPLTSRAFEPQRGRADASHTIACSILILAGLSSGESVSRLPSYRNCVGLRICVTS